MDLLGVDGIAGSHLRGRWDAVPVHHLQCHFSKCMRLDRINSDSILEIDATGRPLADKAREVIYWYFAEVTKMKADMGVSEVEKQASRGGEDA
jgi:hypothetical protein